METLRHAIGERIVPTADPAAGWWTLLAVAVALVLVAVPAAWRPARLAVTIVHELGHAVVGILVGRRFTGFVVSADMSGHAVTVGRSRGFGRVVSTWAGYPAPAVVGAVLTHIAFGGFSRTTLFADLVILVVSLVFVRSAHTLATVLVAVVAIGALWWWGSAALAAAVVLGAGVFLLLGAWRHFGAVMAHGRRQDDPQQLAQLTGVPTAVWVASYVLVLAACTWWGWRALAPHVL
ncbi:M50 family metallopeptidase [Brachybacterium huguangmaarense]|uniref:M50 family metallopeptidase n=1 Tax=Brachybacterium huguangmaarense TaxID=1652028 RepID=A0ABY6G4S4_9MICO|nr:M50 family metallopeptidase [Brachybacterium huguangmaarense]